MTKAVRKKLYELESDRADLAMLLDAIVVNNPNHSDHRFLRKQYADKCKELHDFLEENAI